jgi:hypothetical protein
MTGHLASKIAGFFGWTRTDRVRDRRVGTLLATESSRQARYGTSRGGFRYQSRPTAAACVWPALALA